MYRVNRKGARTVACGATVLQTHSPHILWPVGEVVEDPGREVLVHSHEPQLVPQKRRLYCVVSMNQRI